MKNFLILFIVFNTIVLHSQNFSSLNNDLTSTLSVYSISVNGTDMYIGTNDGVYYSANISNNWVARNTDLQETDVYALAFSSAAIYAGTYYGLFSSTDKGYSWNDLTSGVTDPIVVYDVLVSGTVILAGCDYGLYRSTDNGKSWAKISTFENTAVQCLISKKSGTTTYIYAGTYGSGIYRSSNLGASWSAINDGSILVGDEYITTMYAKDDGTIFAGERFGFLYKSTDFGNSWITLDNDFVIGGYINKIDYNTSTNELFAGVDYYSLYKSTDEGINWESCSDTVLKSDMSAKSLFVINENIYVGTVDNGIFKSKLPVKNVSVSSISLSGNLEFGEVEIGKYSTSDLNIYNDGNIELKIDSISFPVGFSGNWSGSITSKQTKTISIKFSPTQAKSYNGNLIVYSNASSGTNTLAVSGSGIVTSVSNQIDTKNTDVLLYPNPASDNITISMADGYNFQNGVNCSIFNYVGLKIKQFDDMEFSGKNSLFFSIEDLPSGIYYFTLNFGLYKITKFFVIVR